jgi:hypothetical protein
MGSKLRCLFLICLLFVDLTDDLCAVVCPTVVPECSVGLTEPTVLLSVDYRKQFIDQIEAPTLVSAAFAMPYPARGAAWNCVAAAAVSLPASTSLYELMSLQR